MQEEKQYLQNVVECINKQINDVALALLETTKEENVTKDQITSNFYDMDDEELSRQKVELDEREKVERILKNSKARLERQLDKPYFARIDFTPKDEKTQKVYIGIGLVKDNENPLVFDWRAPISSMYYEFETGKSFYDCEEGRIFGNIDLKRQYEIKDQKLKFFIDTKETVNDLLLQEVLSKNSSAKMREIVSTIQKDQNKLIRCDENKNILVQGVAGSGKTSIALHRAAFLLYKNKNSFKSSDIFILSPSDLFSNYISDVLPQLGETNANGTTFLTIAKSELDKKVLTRDILIDELENSKETKAFEEIAYKSSFEFLQDLKDFLEKIFVNTFAPKELSFKTKKSEKPLFLFTKEEMEKLYFQTYQGMSIEKRISYMADILIERFNLKKNEFLPIKERFSKILYGFFPTTDLQEILNLFYLSKGIKENTDNTYHYDDVPALLIIKDFMFGLKTLFDSKYLIIDEMQDFTPAHFYLFNKIWNCPKLVLGDINQCIEKNLSKEYLSKLAKFLSAEIIELNKTYRSTKQISVLAQKIINLKDVENMNRNGEDPQIEKCENQIEKIINFVEENSHNFKHIAIIAKTSKEARELFKDLNKKIVIQILNDIQNEIKGKVVLTTPATSKGVEFDCVIVPNCDEENYHDQLDRNLLYISTTRALHKLCIFYKNKLSKFIKTN